MKAVIQRVTSATLSVDGKLISQIQKGLVVYFCVEKGDQLAQCDLFARKLPNLRIFDDPDGKMNLSVLDVGGQVLMVSQFTLAADLSRGNRPSFFGSEEPIRANEMFEYTVDKLAQTLPTQKGVFGAHMYINQVNDGPVTIIWEAKPQ